MEVVPIVVLLVLSMGLLSLQSPMETLDDVLVNPVEPALRTRVKREASSTVAQRRQLNFEQFIEDKLIQHGKALEQLLKSVQKNEELTKTLLDNIGNQYVSEPKMPEKIEFISRRTQGGSAVVVPGLIDTNEISPWCTVAMSCRRKVDPVCGFDENFGYGKFDDVCHMLQVNCYWKYNFALANNCKPSV
ncbi:uncharacterized protein LOC113238813 [Hyposmocoma kahamanoa]|uniref:uncharacterized protein LOC113238813 n=1 Tax=Hyposmocoma kahamanoa TaxID=1477025 RepID=UPI000E6D6EBD|nr:uncharacterized protein LOC113238813 [Hyposmocoma kahamanoa]